MREKFASCHFRDFIILEELYRSRIGIVYKVQFKYDQKVYVLKERKIAELGQRKDILNEVKLLQQLRSQNIVQYEGWFRDDDRKALFIVLEYCNGGDLYHFLEKRKETGRSHRSRGGRGSDVASAGIITASTDRDRDGWKFLTEREIWFIFYQICIGLKHLHENGIIHRDIKTLNVFLSFINESHVFFKIGDLGVSRQVSENTFLLNTFYGTPLYLSPELIENKAYNEKTDIWSLGIILYELIMLQPPFIGNSMMELSQKVLAGEYEPIPSDRYPAPSSLGRCVAWLLTKDYTKRPNIAQVIDYVAKKVDPSYHGETLLPSSMNSRPSTASTANKEKDREKVPSVAAVIPVTVVEEKTKAKALPPPPQNLDENDDIEEDSLDEASPVERNQKKSIMTTPQPPGNSKPSSTPSPALPLPSPPEVKSDVASKPVARKYPKIPQVSAEDEGSVIVTVDLPRIHAKHRREIVKYRKLLQMRDFILGGAGAVGEEGKDLDQRMEELLRLIQLYEYAMEKKTLPQSFALRYQLPILPEKNATPQPELIVQPSHRIVDESLPVYLQQPPLPQKRQVLSPSPNQQANRVLRPKTASAAVASRGNGDDEDEATRQKKEVILNALWAKNRPQQPNPSSRDSPNAPPRSSSTPSSPPPPRAIYENQQPRHYQHYLDQHHQHRQDLLVQQQQNKDIVPNKEKRRRSGSGEVEKEMKEVINLFNNVNRDDLQSVPLRQIPFQVNPTPAAPAAGLGLILPSMKNKPKQDKHSKFIEVHQDQNSMVSSPRPSPPPRQKMNHVNVVEEEKRSRPRPKTASASAQSERKAEQGSDNKSMVEIISDRRRLYHHNRMVSDVTAYQEVLPKYHKADSHVSEILHQEKRKEIKDQEIVEDTDDEAPERSDVISSTDDEGSPERRRIREKSRPKTSSPRQRAEDEGKSFKAKEKGKSERGRGKADVAPTRNKTRIDRVIRHQQQSDYNIITGAGF